jgi:hypothetical protein
MKSKMITLMISVFVVFPQAVAAQAPESVCTILEENQDQFNCCSSGHAMCTGLEKAYSEAGCGDIGSLCALVNLKRDFDGNTQGVNNLYYQYFDHADAQYHNMLDVKSLWFGNIDAWAASTGPSFSAVFNVQGIDVAFHPGELQGSKDGVITWVSDIARNVEVIGVVYDLQVGYFDGADFEILKNSNSILTRQINDFHGNQPLDQPGPEMPFSFTESLNAGDRLHFRVNKRLDISGDGTFIRIEIREN